MLSYRHAFHAGNSADVLKHFVIERILSYLTQKDKPCFYMDTHAGAGIYSLNAAVANKTAEYKVGIERILAAWNPPETMRNYIQCIARCRDKNGSDVYPGSPWFAADILRSIDRLALCELHPQDYPSLASVMAGDSRVKVYNEDGFKKSIALLPPKERRGLVVIDPSYEIKADYVGVVNHICSLYKRFATGVYALWYPVVDAARIEKMVAQFKKAGLKNTQRFQIQTYSPDKGGMYASGMIVINAPWILQTEVGDAMPWLRSSLALDESAGFIVETITGENA
ncbi:23S rRNA (adenine(2030)-N(6))-methyltransferase RlmJ [Marinagarivorans cellulosilyticus]|uniref:Ribosomal RNA large subunit methyltransferase J n=1 Tax=Marinagarivorans cellulosilyticus TaxID=2721545 RepID=A0AAN1WKQ0_9GAMM|nr:23S rRNA (adenine(2030)-N(6))-methyltransferase RlmJ [Marinagarivorans cellulosilyticus]BCD99370.1 23S rRNA (adenine2030-N6)-methyltransferase [Marinagarivorans cellulosilyticus]